MIQQKITNVPSMPYPNIGPPHFLVRALLPLRLFFSTEITIGATAEEDPKKRVVALQPTKSVDDKPVAFRRAQCCSISLQISKWEPDRFRPPIYRRRESQQIYGAAAVVSGREAHSHVAIELTTNRIECRLIAVPCGEEFCHVAHRQRD
jgi:hypothetical protein